MNVIKFKCNDCGSEKYKLVYWKLKDRPQNIGVYCVECEKWFKFLGKNEKLDDFPQNIEVKNQRPRKKKRIRS